MARLWSCSKKTASIIVGMGAILLYIWMLTWSKPAGAAPLSVPGLGSPSSAVEPARIFKRGRPPIYPFYYAPGRPGGYSFYFGFVPYERGDYEIQALQRQYPESNWPPSMRYWTPKSNF